ncbi:MAG: tetratricopeptide repeat protein [Crenarchaeota archaeon]|nr:MAG: tetratricopeptide repeat protein [Thermoproteota archaeon]RDJ33577.1 MAG: tetratricopeptide repeat protein [Thermoproteota archaeon]RDJ38100.1 MAG: tetratricopeptide repeat protein [Thermoproteota archaeon]RDJ39131.1 MAG: tetratricopeptide repeat protein [Thermoproteota archaeon]
MGTKIILFLAIASCFIVPAFADSGILLGTDKEEYSVGDTLTITGEVEEKKMPSLALRVYDPDGAILSANNVEILDDNSFSKTISLVAPFYEKSGEYQIKIDYGKIKTSETFLISGESIQETTVTIIPEITEFSAEKNEYTDGEFVTIRGKVSSQEEPTVLIGIYDPFGIPGGFYFGVLDANNEFEISFLIVDNVNFKIEGTYSAVAHYADSEQTAYFDYVMYQEEPIQTPIVTEEELDALEESFDALEDEINDELKELEETLRELENELKEIEPTTVATKQNNIVSDVKPKKETANTKVVLEEEPQKNLSVEDIELGIMLNEMALRCDKSTLIDVVSYYDGMGPALFRLCKYSEAISFFDQDLSKNPKNLAAITNIGAALNKLGLFPQAIQQFDSALEINPNYIPALNNKANSLSQMGNHNEALSLYLQVLEIDPKFSTSKINMDTTQKNIPVKNLIFQENEQKPTPIISNQESPKVIKTIPQENESDNFFEKIGQVFASIGSIFGF